jgi:hypothetical protein
VQKTNKTGRFAGYPRIPFLAAKGHKNRELQANWLRSVTTKMATNLTKDCPQDSFNHHCNTLLA